MSKGLYRKYEISRTDGTPIDPDNEYFVLKVEGNGDERHMEACRKAILVYAEEVKEFLPHVSKDIKSRYGK